MNDDQHRTNAGADGSPEARAVQTDTGEPDAAVPGSNDSLPAAGIDLVEAGRRALLQGDVAEAVEVLQQAAIHEPARIDVQEMLGAALCQSGRVDDGIVVFEGTVDQHPTSAQAHFNLGAAYRQSGRLDEAHHQLDVALRLDPDYARARAARVEWSGDILENQSAETDVPAADEPQEDRETASTGSGGEEGVLSSSEPAVSGSQPPTAVGTASEEPPAPPVPEFHPEPTLVPGTPTGVMAPLWEAGIAPGGLPLTGELRPGGPTQAPPAASGAGSHASPSGSHPSTETRPGTFEARPAPEGAPLELFDEEDIPTPGELFLNVLRRPYGTIAEGLPEFCESPACLGQTAVLFLAASLAWGLGLLFHPGGDIQLTAGTVTGGLVLSLLCPVMLLAVQTTIVVLGSATFTGHSFGADFRAVGLRFVFVWAAIHLALMTIAGVIQLISHIPAALPLGVIGILWSFALNFRVLTGYYSYDFGRALLLLLLAQIAGNGLALSALYLFETNV